MDYHTGHVLTLANSIIGVGVLAMPYCFKQCGIVLSILLLLISSIISRLACHFLVKSAINSRRKTFEILAFYIFGALGKFMIEIGIIGFLLGTCIAFFVVMGDLAPEIICEMTGVKRNDNLRTISLVIIAFFCILPLGLQRNIDSLSGVSKATLGFYGCLVLKIIVEALPHIFSSGFYSGVVWWEPSGILQCLPIFSMALFCQTQLFEMYQALPNISLEKMNNLVRTAVIMCTSVYIFVGTFGYIAFYQHNFSGNILLSFTPSLLTDFIKLGFVLSVAFSFPLVIFPCRASMFSLFYKGIYSSLHESSSANYIPEGKFNAITVLIVLISLIIGIWIPSIELVLGLVGSTIGVTICILFPVACFICISPKNTNERLLAQILLFVGVIMMVLGTYANLYGFERSVKNELHDEIKKLSELPEMLQHKKHIMDIPDLIKDIKLDDIGLPATTFQPLNVELNEKDIVDKFVDKDKMEYKENVKEIRHEPPQPEEPIEVQTTIPDKVAEENIDSVGKKQNDIIQDDVNKESLVNNKDSPKMNVQPNKSVINDEGLIEVHKNLFVRNISHNITLQENSNGTNKFKPIPDTKLVEGRKDDEVDIEAIKKEDTELKAQEAEQKNEGDRQNKELLESLKKHNEYEKEIVEQQKLLLKVMQKQQEKIYNKDIQNVNEAVRQIEDVAKKAIESLSGKVKLPKLDDLKIPEAANEEKNIQNPPKKIQAPVDVKTNSTNLNTKVNTQKESIVNSKINLPPIPIIKYQNINTTNHIQNKSAKEDMKPETKSKSASNITSDKKQNKITAPPLHLSTNAKKEQLNKNIDTAKVQKNQERFKESENSLRKKRDTRESLSADPVKEVPLIKTSNLSANETCLDKKNIDKEF